MRRIGEDRGERLDVVPAQLRVLVTIRPRYACRRCDEGVHQQPAPARVVTGGLPTEALLVQVLMSKYGDGIPLHRQCQILARQGIESMQTCGGWFRSGSIPGSRRSRGRCRNWYGG